MTYKEVLDYLRKDKDNKAYKNFINLLINHMWRD